MHNATGSTMNRSRFIFIMLIPAVLVLFFITIVPFIMNLINSLRDYYLASAEGPTFKGLLNYYEILFKDRNFWHSFYTTILFTLGAVTVEFWFGLAIAGLISKNESKFSRFVQGTFVLPLAATPIAIAFIWRLMYSPSLGIINYFLSLLHLPKLSWVADPKLALISLIIVDVWQWTPFMMLILLAGLKALPLEPFEAAKVDGATGWKTFIRVTLPLLKPVAMTCILFRTIDAFKTFDIIFTITRGGPGNATETLNVYTFLKGLNYLRMGYASALAIIMLITIIIFSQLMIRYTGLQSEVE